MKILSIIMTILIFSLGTAQAHECRAEEAKTKSHAKYVNDVLFVTETDDDWTAFSSTTKISGEVTAEKIREALDLGDTYEGESSYFNMEGYSEAYAFLRSEIESYGPEYYNEPATQSNIGRFIRDMSRDYGTNVRLIQFGQGDGDSYFVGYHMIVLIHKSGCVTGIKALTVWT